MTSSRGWLPKILFAVALTAALARVSGFFTDDSYIHLVFARNLTRGHAFCFNPGEPVYGFTSPLWMLLLAGAHYLVPDWLMATRLLGLLFTLLAIVATYRLARAAGGSPRAGEMAAAALALHAWFLRWSLSGMETSLAALLVAAGLAGVLRGGRAATAGMIALALAALARPEALILFGAAGIWALRSGGERSASGRGPAVAGATLGAATILAWELVIHGVTGAWIPNAYTVKRFHEAVTPAGVARDVAHLAGIVGITDAVLIFAVAASAIALRRRREPLGPMALLLLWPALLAGFYLGARVQMISRYWVPAIPALCAAAWVGVERAWGGALADGKRGGALRLGSGFLALYLTEQLAVFLILIAPQIDAFTRGLNRGPVEIGRWLNARAPARALVATPDIGAIGFYGERPVLDLGGLVTPRMAPILASHDVHEVIEGALYEQVGQPDYLVDRAARPGALVASRRPSGEDRYQLILTSRMENLGISRPEPVYYSLYRVLPGAAP